MCNMVESDLFILLIGQIDGQEISAAAVLPPRVISRPRRSPPRRPPPRWERPSPPRGSYRDRRR